MNPLHAVTILTSCGIPRGADFHALSTDQKLALKDWSRTCKYRHRDTSGSGLLAFHRALERHAVRWQQAAPRKSECERVAMIPIGPDRTSASSPAEPTPLAGLARAFADGPSYVRGTTKEVARQGFVAGYNAGYAAGLASIA